ncbi:MAG: RidA family protein [Thermoplasmata archaeon]
MNVYEQLEKLNIKLPSLAKPVGFYIPAIRDHEDFYTSGMLPLIDGKLVYQGKLGDELSTDHGMKAAEISTINCLSALHSIISLDKLRIIRVEGYVNSTPSFTDHSKVMNGASELIYKIFQEDGLHTRIAIGVSSLPMNSPVEVVLVAKLK